MWYRGIFCGERVIGCLTVLQKQGETHQCQSCGRGSSNLTFLGLSMALSKCQSLSGGRGGHCHWNISHRLVRQAGTFPEERSPEKNQLSHSDKRVKRKDHLTAHAMAPAARAVAVAPERNPRMGHGDGDQA